MAVQVLLALLPFVAAVTLFNLISWGRRFGMFLFLVMVAVSVPVVASGSLFAFVVIALNLSAMAMLAMDADAFVTERPDIDESGSATRFGTQ